MFDVIPICVYMYVCPSSCPAILLTVIAHTTYNSPRKFLIAAQCSERGWQTFCERMEY
jgi:hypothetical protein